MWILKGLSLGLAFFVVGTIAFLLMTVMRPRPGVATSLSALQAITINNPGFWVALLACLALGVALVGSWPVPVQR